MKKRALGQDFFIYACLFVLCLQFIGHHFFVDCFRSTLLDTPISLNPSEEVVKQISIRMPQRYILQFSFAKEGHDFKKLIKLIGGVKPEERGEKIPVEWSLTNSKTGLLIIENHLKTSGAYFFSGKEIGRYIDSFTVSPGLYTLKFEVLQPVPELQGIQTRLKVAYSEKNGTTWHSGYMWWGMLFNVLIIPTLSMFLLYRLYLNRENRLDNEMEEDTQ